MALHGLFGVACACENHCQKDGQVFLALYIVIAYICCDVVHEFVWFLAMSYECSGFALNYQGIFGAGCGDCYVPQYTPTHDNKKHGNKK